ncbi:GLPGLI family protein [uncultured Polaribacter sp.]|uniref:GLPGLI family protein n=1 Tax=uncultured Polaribacter sp. TaxID=174711 RepID=UPI00261ADC5B|nr:GLPGLI family protein [uncultured Polaribacter sp.]
MKQILLLIIFFLFSLNLQSQSGKITYVKRLTAKMNKDTLNSIKHKKLKTFNEKIILKLDKIKYLLIFNKKVSSFNVVNKLENENDRFLKLASRLGGGKGVFYTELKSNLILQKAEGFGDVFLIKRLINIKKWRLTNESKIINKHKCFKAVLVREGENTSNVYVWFTPKIPFNFGPLQYSGFPGLVLEVNLGNGYSFFAEKIELSNKTVKIKKPTKGKLVTFDEFKEIGKKVMKRTKK